MPAPFSTPIPYPRPARLSDPGHDFTPEECAAILAVPDDRLGWPELGEIFQSYLPAGDYAECAYFIPRALRFIDERGGDASDVADNFIAWAGEQKRELDADGLFAPIRDHLVALLRECLSGFRIEFGPAKGKDAPFPADSDLAETLIVSLNRSSPRTGEYPFGKAATPVFLDTVGRLRSLSDASWFAHFASWLERGIFHNGEVIDAPLFECLTDENNAVRARDILREGVRRDPSLAACWAKWFRGSSWTLDKPEAHPHPATS